MNLKNEIGLYIHRPVAAHATSYRAIPGYTGLKTSSSLKQATEFLKNQELGTLN